MRLTISIFLEPGTSKLSNDLEESKSLSEENANGLEVSTLDGWVCFFFQCPEKSLSHVVSELGPDDWTIYVNPDTELQHLGEGLHGQEVPTWS